MCVCVYMQVGQRWVSLLSSTSLLIPLHFDRAVQPNVKHCFYFPPPFVAVFAASTRSRIAYIIYIRVPKPKN